MFVWCALVLEEECYEEMMTKFGKLVDLEALQTLSGNRKLEELRQRKFLKETDHDKEIREWDVRAPVLMCYPKKKQKEKKMSFWDEFLFHVIVFVCAVQAKMREEHQALLEVIERNTALLQTSSGLTEEKRELNEKIRTRQTETVTSVYFIYSLF